MAVIEEQHSRLHGGYNLENEPSTSAAARVSQVPERTEHKKANHKYGNILHGIGVAELVIGIVSMLLAVASIITCLQYHYYVHAYTYHRYYHEMTFSSPGIWTGALLIASGIVGIKSRTQPSVCVNKANIVVSIMAAVFMLIFIVLSALAISNNVTYYESQFRIYSLIAIHSALLVLAITACVLCIVHSYYSCAGVRPRQKSFEGAISYVPQPYGVHHTYQFIRFHNDRIALVPSPPSEDSFSVTFPGSIQSEEEDPDIPQSSHMR